MKLLRVHILSADTCGGLLDGFEVQFRSPTDVSTDFDTLCFVGPNGTGKSQLMQVIAEMLQSAIYACSPGEERSETNPNLTFDLEYLITPEESLLPTHVKISRKTGSHPKGKLSIQIKDGERWKDCALEAIETRALLPKKIVGYTSGDNETLSLPFLISRSGYADAVSQMAFDDAENSRPVTDTRLMLIDYGTHLEVLVANLLLGSPDERNAILEDALVRDLHSFRCIVQLAHPAAPKVSTKQTAITGRKGVQLTRELERYIDQLRRCATCHSYDEKSEVYIFDYFVDQATRKGFVTFWKSAIELYASFHKLAMLNDLAIARSARLKFRKDAKIRRFASRLPEPQDEDKVFRFERLAFVPQRGSHEVDYVSLSDGEHQLAQLLGTFCMLSAPNILFLLDEPESHFNPLWRVKFLSRLRELPTDDGRRSDNTPAARQECVMTTHAPFVPSDMARDKVFIFSKNNGKVSARHPDIETYGTTFDSILEECFDVHPPISELPKEEIAKLMKSTSIKRIRSGIERLGSSVEKAFLTDRLRQLQKKGSR
jgi:restriction system-associated AAA family ATPase